MERIKTIWLENYRRNSGKIEYVSVQKWNDMNEEDKLEYLGDIMQKHKVWA